MAGVIANEELAVLERANVLDSKKVLVVYPYLPHYRLGVFRELDKSSREFSFAAGGRSPDGSIPPIAPGMLGSVLTLRNVWFGPFLFQVGLLSHLFRGRYGHVIFLGDVKHITTWLGLAIARVRGVRTHLWTIGWHRPEDGLKRWIRNRFYSLCDQLMLYGSDGRDIGLSMGFPQDRMVIIGNSQEVSMSGPSMKPVVRGGVKMRGEESAVTVGAVVRLQPAKRLALLLAAAQRLEARGHFLRVLLVGDGPERALLEELAKNLGIQAEFRGSVYDATELAKVYAALDITVLPEFAGLAVLTSLSHGIPVVTVNDPFRQVPEFRAVVPGVTGGLYEPEDVEDLADVIEVWIARLRSDPLSVREACMAEVQSNWTPKANAERLLHALDMESVG